MTIRRYISLSARAAEIYDNLPRGTRGDVVSQLLVEQMAPALPSLTRLEVERVRDAMDKLLRDFDRLQTKAG